MDSSRLKDRVALVCGAGSVADGLSIGMATSVLFAREGAKVFAVNRSLDHAQGTRLAIAKAGGECTLHQADVSDEEQVHKMVEACIARYGRVDVLYNNVGIYLRGGPLEESPADFERIMRVNLTSMYLTIRAVVPHMISQQRGAIVNVSSVAGIRAMAPNAAYAASKAAVLALSQNVGLTYATRGIRCNAVVPGYIETPRVTTRLREQSSDASDYELRLAKSAQQVPTGRMGDPWDVAHASLFLACDESKYVNATSLVVDGGLSASTTGQPW